MLIKCLLANVGMARWAFYSNCSSFSAVVLTNYPDQSITDRIPAASP